MTRTPLISLLVGLPRLPNVASGQVVRSGSGTNNVDATLLAARDAFRLDLGGGTTAGVNDAFGGVRREINWDGIPVALPAPTSLNATFFNTNSQRAVVVSTPGAGFRVSSATADASLMYPSSTRDRSCFDTLRCPHERPSPARWAFCISQRNMHALPALVSDQHGADSRAMANPAAYFFSPCGSKGCLTGSPSFREQPCASLSPSPPSA